MLLFVTEHLTKSTTMKVPPWNGQQITAALLTVTGSQSSHSASTVVNIFFSAALVFDLIDKSQWATNKS